MVATCEMVYGIVLSGKEVKLSHIMIATIKISSSRIKPKKNQTKCFKNLHESDEITAFLGSIFQLFSKVDIIIFDEKCIIKT